MIAPRAIAALAASLGLACVMSGCNGDSQVEVSVNNRNGGIVGTKSSSQELTLNQGVKLLQDIRKNPDRMKTLTPPERRFLAKTLAQDARDAERR